VLSVLDVNKVTLSPCRGGQPRPAALPIASDLIPQSAVAPPWRSAS
jgi:hypothetical protein